MADFDQTKYEICVNKPPREFPTMEYTGRVYITINIALHHLNVLEKY